MALWAVLCWTFTRFIKTALLRKNFLIEADSSYLYFWSLILNVWMNGWWAVSIQSAHSDQKPISPPTYQRSVFLGKLPWSSQLTSISFYDFIPNRLKNTLNWFYYFSTCKSSFQSYCTLLKKKNLTTYL